MISKSKKVPRLKKVEDEAFFWEKRSAADFDLVPIDVGEVLEDLKRQHQKKRNVTFRLEPELMKRLGKRAKKAGVKYQTFIREWLWRAVA